MRDNLKALVPHQFGDHSLCQPRFCGYKRTPEMKYIHRSLPYKVPLTDCTLKSKLQEIFEPVIAKSLIYSNLGSSQACEHAHRAASLRAPKHLHYGESESLDFRVKATAACINEGRSYLSETFRKHGLSPGSYTVPYNLKKDHEREKRQQKASLPEKKLRRLQLKEERAVSKGAFEASEGASYDSEITLGVQAEDIEIIPEPVPKPSFSAISLSSPTFIFIDLETTDLIRRNSIPHIVQLAAIERNSKNCFSRYITPGVPMSAEAERVTGVVWDGHKLYSKGNEILTNNIVSALNEFIVWLNQFDNVVLLAHNGKNFDFRVLSKAMENCKLFDNFIQAVAAFVDTLSVFRSKCKDLGKYNQVYLAQYFCQEEYNAHNAEDDVSMLDKIVRKADVTTEDLLKYSYMSNVHQLQDKFNFTKSKNLGSLHPLVASGILKMTTAENIAGSGLNCAHLKLIFSRKGEDGLVDVFMSKNSLGKPRVSSDKKLISSIVTKMCQYFSEL